MIMGDWLFYFAMGAGAVLLAYDLVIFIRLAIYKSPTITDQSQPFTIVIAARNEEDNLRRFLPKVLGQRARNFDVVVVDDCSVDETKYLLEELVEQYPNLKTTALKESAMFEGGKKYAVTLGIKSSEFENILFIDADCVPSSEDWAATLNAALSARPIVIGYGGYMKKSGLLNKLIRFDTVQIAWQYLSFALAGVPYMAVGRNMAYKSHLFFDNKGFAKHIHLKSGDDDLFVNQVAEKGNTQVVFDKKAFTFSEPETSISAWFRQKRRHLTTAKKYKALHQVLLGLLPFSQYLFFGACFAMLFVPEWQLAALVALGIRTLVHWGVGFFVFRKVEEGELIWFAPVLELMMLVIYPAIVFSNIIERSQSWKR